MNRHLEYFYFDKMFLNIYDFLLEHRRFELILHDMRLWVSILKCLEK